MIFRRLKAHIEKENWFAVFIDFCIVVIGVFIGIQVANWNSEQTDRGIETQYMTRLLGELESMASEADAAFEENRERAELIGQINDYFGTGTGGSDLGETHCGALARSHIFAGVIRYPPTIKELIATGRIVIIRDDALRSSILSFDQVNEQISQLRTDIQIDRLILHRKYPELIQHEDQWGDVGCDFDAMRNSAQFRNDFFDNRNRNLAYVYLVLERQKDLIVSLGEEVAQSLRTEFRPDTSSEEIE